MRRAGRRGRRRAAWRSRGDPGEAWLTLGPDAAPRREGPAHDPRDGVRRTGAGCAPASAHERSRGSPPGASRAPIGAGETPGAEEWVVTPVGVVRYMAGEARRRRAREGRGRRRRQWGWIPLARRWFPGDRRSYRDADAGAGADSGAGPALDDDGWLRMSEGEVTLAGPQRRADRGGPRRVDRCAALAAALPGACGDAPRRVGERRREHGKGAGADPPPGARRVRRRVPPRGHSAPIGSQGRNVGPARGCERRLGSSRGHPARGVRAALTAVDMLHAVPLASLKGA